jgi:transposase
MTEKILIVGVDVSKDKLDVAYVFKGEEKPQDLGIFPNQNHGFSNIAKKLQKFLKNENCNDFEVVIEPTGGYEKPFVQFCLKQNWKAKVVVPYRVRQWAKSQGTRGKTDALDARVLALYGANHTLPEWTFLPEEVQILDSLLQRIDQIEEHLTQEKNRRHSLEAKGEFNGVVAKSIDHLISILEEEIDKLRKDINKHLKDYPQLKEEQKRLKELPGVGDKNSLPLLTFLYQFFMKTSGQGTTKGITAFGGLDPVPFGSGDSVYKRPTISRQGNPRIRELLYLGAFGGMQSKDPNNPLKLFVERLVSRGKKKKVALVAAARKILVWAWTIFQKKTHFDPMKAIQATS